MATFTDATFLTAYQQTDNVQREIKTDEFGLIEAVRQDTPFYKGLTPALKAFIETQNNRTFSRPALIEQVHVSASVESFNIPANISTSEATTGTLVTLFGGFHYYDALSRENMISKEEYINNKLTEVFKSMALAKEATTLTAIDGQKTQVLTYNPLSSDGITYAASTLTATLAAQQQLLFSNLQVVAEANGLMGNMRMVASPGVKAMQNFREMYGATNSVNLQESGMVPKLTTSNRVTNSARWTGYLWKEGSFAYVNNFKSAFVEGKSLNGGSIKWDISRVPMPFLNERVMTYYEIGKADVSALMVNSAQDIMDTVEKFGFIHRYVILTPYNSVIGSNVNPVIKVVGSAS